jgi:hypothetical protein
MMNPWTAEKQAGYLVAICVKDGLFAQKQPINRSSDNKLVLHPQRKQRRSFFIYR